jgi:hypothetical protein
MFNTFMSEFASEGQQRQVRQELHPSSERLTDERAAHFIFPSFRLSQGNPVKDTNSGEFQRNLFRYLHAAHPSWKVDNPDRIRDLATDQIKNMFFPGGPDKKRTYPPGEFFAKVADRITKLVAPVKIDGKRYPRRTPLGIHADVRAKDIEFQTKFTVDSLKNVLDPSTEQGRNEATATKEQLVPILVDNFVSTDAFYLGREGGRKRANPDSSNFRDDPYSSYTLEYIMRERPTGDAEFDEMCVELRKYILHQTAQPTPEWTDTTGSLLNSVISIYNDHHSSEQQYTLPSPENALQELSTNGQKDQVSEALEVGDVSLPEY